MHCVRVNGVTSPYEPVLSGIPQGSILGPLLFIFYVNGVLGLDITSILKLFADDAKLYRKIRNPNDIVEMQEDLNRVCDFFDDWQLKINVSKSEILHLGHNNANHSYTMNSADIPAKSVCRDLGIQISDDNKFSRHINELTRVAFFRLKQLRLAFSCKDLDFQVHLYTTFVRPKLEYNTNVWSPHLLQDIDAVEDVQKLFTRTLPGMEG